MNKRYTKKEIELILGERFINLYNISNKSDYKVIRNGEQGRINEPDLICSSGLTIEIVSVDYGESMREKTEIDIKKYGISNSGVFEGPDKRAFSRLIDAIKTKNKKTYDVQNSEKIILLVDARETSITTTKDYKEFFKSTNLENYKFNEVWIFRLRAYVSGVLEDVEGSIVNETDIIYKLV